MTQSPSSQIAEVDLEQGFEGGPGRSKSSDQDGHERQKYKGDVDNHEAGKNEPSELSKEDNLEIDGKTRLKKQLKSELGSDSKDSSVESERLAARKRRFAEPSGKIIRPKRSKVDEEEASDVGQKEIETHKESQRRDSRPKADKKDGQEDHKGHKEKSELLTDLQDSKRHGLPRRFSHDGSLEQAREEQHGPLKFSGPSSDVDKSAKSKDDHVDIDLSQSYRKQMEQNRRLQQQQRESDKLEKPESPRESKSEDMEDRSLVYEVGKPPEDVTDNFPSHKFKRLDQFDAETGVKRERVYRSFRHKSEDPDWNSGLSPGHSHHIENNFVSPSRKEMSRNDDKMPEMERLKKTHDTQIKPNTPVLSVEEEQQKRWENRVKQDFLPDQNFSRSKGFHNRKRLEYGVWHDLEPGEVRSDSEEDREGKTHSPVPSTSMNFSERLRGERFSDPKLAQLEKNKFYSFAHDRTITPDTKALLERAKSLSREDNWSFLDYDPHLASFRDRKDTVKVESAPKPIKPVSWYRRYKTRSGSEDKLDDRKEEPKPEEQERKELFASRFFHSAVFELDSRRLQHLERKHEEPVNNPSQPGQLDGMDGETETGPIILFHSRFLELTKQQQKNKTQQEAKVEPVTTEENKLQNVTSHEPQAPPVSQSPQTIESVREPELKPFSPVEETVPEPQLSPAAPKPEVNTISPAEVRTLPIMSTLEQCPPVCSVKEDTKEEIKVYEHIDPLHQLPPEISPKYEPAPESNFSLEKPLLSPGEGKSEINEYIKSEDSDTKSHRISQDEEVTAAAEISPEVVPEVPEDKTSIVASPKQETEVGTESPNKADAEPDEEKPPLCTEQTAIQNEIHEELALSLKENKQKEIKSKKCIPAPADPCPVMSPSISDKQATRKSERIDKEKTKRGSSPRGEAKSTAKSPVHGSDPDGPVGRRSRRNVKSVYATPVEDEAPVRSGKEVSESPRAGRKRGTDKEAVQHNLEQEPPAPAPAVKRGRPPKNRKQNDENTAIKTEKLKGETKDTDSNESESGERTQRLFKGRHSPHGTKSTSGYGSGRKGDKAEVADDQQMDITGEHAAQDSLKSSKDDQTKCFYKKEEKDKEQKDALKDKESPNEQTYDGKSNDKEAESTEEKYSTDKEKSGRGKTKLPKVPKSPVLKNLKIRLNVTEVKDLLQLGEDELANQEDSSKKVRPTDEVEKAASSVKVVSSSEEKENLETDKKEPLEAAKIQELEQAVENIAKLTEPTFPKASTPTEMKSEPDPEEEKPIQANETELMAAIDSITGEDTPLSQPTPVSAEVGSEPEVQENVQPAKGEDAEADSSNMQEELYHPSTPKKGAKGRPKTPKRPKGQKQIRKDCKEEGPSEELPSTAESPVSTVKVIPEKTSPAVAAVITPTSWTPMPEPSVVKSLDVKVEIERPSEDQGPPPKSVYPQPRSPVCPKPQQVSSESVATSPTFASRTNIRPPQAHRPSVSSPDWLQAKEPSGSSLPAISIQTKDPSPLHEVDKVETEHAHSDLRKILMQPKNKPLVGSLTPTAPLPLREQNTSDSHQLTTMPNKSPLPESRLAAHPVPAHSVPPIVRPPASLPSPETKTVISVIASTATSVISRVCNPPEHEDKVTNAVNPCLDMTLPKPVYRQSKEDTGPYHGQSGDDVGSARFIIESPAPTSGSCPGLRVNTSEGVVLLSHSMQKLEGRQRISAKISQIPQATAGDMESQQLVSMPQIKQDMYGHPQSGLQKGPSQDHGHPGKSQSMKHEATSVEKMEAAYQPGPPGVVKRVPQGVGNQQVMGYHQDYLSMKHSKKMDSADPHSSDTLKPSWTSAISPAISPHLPSPPGNHVSFVTGSDRAPPHLPGVKQEPRSPRKSGHPQSPFAKVSSPIGSSSPKGIPVMLPTNLPSMQPFITGVHHSEQSVIMPTHPGALGRMSPHRVNQPIPVGHLVQGDVRVNTPPLSVMSYGIHGDPLASPWSAAMQPRPTSPQTVSRDKVLKVNPGALRSHEAEQEEARRFHQVAPRQSATSLKPESMQPDPRAPMRSAVEQYMGQRDMRLLMHQQGERPATDPHAALLQEPIPPSSTPSTLPLSMSPRQAHLLSKGVSEKELTKQLDAKRPLSPLLKDGIMAIRQSGPTIGSPQRVAMMPPGPSSSFPEYPGLYSNPRGLPPPMPEATPVGLSQPHAPPTMMGAELQPKPEGKISQPMVQLLNKYPIVWQGLLALKNDTAAVQLHFVCGNKALAHRSLPLQEGGALLRIVQRMRLEASQLESVARRMTGDSDFCLLLALPCGRDQEDVLNQTQALKAAFINYLQSKLAAGIINIPNPGSNQPAYVLQIFPPCEFSESHLSQLAPDLLNRISSISPHLMIVITSV